MRKLDFAVVDRYAQTGSAGRLISFIPILAFVSCLEHFNGIDIRQPHGKLPRCNPPLRMQRMPYRYGPGPLQTMSPNW